MKKRLYSFLILLTIFSTIEAQYRVGLIPRVSPAMSISNTIGFTEIKMSYCSPTVKNRDIWGELVAYDEVWRAGANEATTIEFTQPARIYDQDIPKGKYAFFVIPRDSDKWTIILNKDNQQWGAFSYNEKNDLCRLEVPVEFIENKYESLSYFIESQELGKGSIRLNWEFAQMNIPIEIDYVNQFTEKIEMTADTIEHDSKWVVLLQGAEFLEEQKTDTDRALHWVKLAEKYFVEQGGQWRNNEDFYLGHIYWVRAKLLAQANRPKEAYFAGKKMKKISGKAGFYHHKIKEEEIDAMMAQWKKM